jgi:hypothetical protein
VAAAKLTFKVPGSVTALSKTFTLLGVHSQCQVTVDIFEKDRKCLVVYGQCFFSYLLACSAACQHVASDLATALPVADGCHYDVRAAMPLIAKRGLSLNPRT